MTTTPHWFGAPRAAADPALMAIAFQMATRMLALVQSEAASAGIPALPEPGMLELLTAAGLPAMGDTAALVDEFLEHKAYQGITDSALYGYRQVLNRLIVVAPWPPYEPRHIIAAVSKDSWNHRTRFTMDANARAFCNWCEVQYGIPSAARRLAKMKRPEKRKRFLNLESLLAVYEAALTGRDRLIIRLCFEAGPRTDEIARMRPGDVDKGRLTLRGKTGERTIPVSEALTDALRAHVRDGLLWRNQRGNRMSDRDVTYAVKQIHRAGRRAELELAQLGAPTAALLRFPLRQQPVPSRRGSPPAETAGAHAAGHHCGVRPPAARGPGRRPGTGQPGAAAGAGPSRRWSCGSRTPSDSESGACTPCCPSCAARGPCGACPRSPRRCSRWAPAVGLKPNRPAHQDIQDTIKGDKR